jgi:hypothetical protein
MTPRNRLPNTTSLALSLAAALVAAACGVHNGQGSADSGGVRSEEPGVEDADPGKPEAKARPVAPKPEAETTPKPQAEAGEASCTIPEGLTVAADALALPVLAGPEGLSVERAGAMVELARTGDVLVRFELTVANGSKAAGTALVGLSWRTPSVGAAQQEPFAGLLLEAAGTKARTCRVESPKEMHQPWVDAGTWIELAVPAGGSAAITGMYKARATQAEKPATLFGYPDRFAENWKNWDWPYTKAPEYAPVAERLKPFHGELALRPAAATKVTLRCRDGVDWLRTMSHEQNAQKLRSPGMYEWNFDAAALPTRLGFEILPDLPIQEEIAAFEALVKARKDDLRARIRLSDLLRFGGDAARRAEVLADLLKVWPGAAKKQLLEGRNDVRAGALVGRVIALRDAGKNAEAEQAAAEGVKLLSGFETKGEGERNGLALSWLSAVARGRP